MDRNCCLIGFFVCIYVIQWYIESCKMLCTWNKIDVKKKEGNQKHHRVLSTSTCDLEECLRPYAMCNIYILFYVYYFQAKLVNNYMYISIKSCICLLIQDQGYLIID
jgi:hypothetical protein